jgi:hypothetical protein
MALDYQTNPTGVFYQIGKIIKTVNAHATMASTTLPAELKQIADPIESSDYTEVIEGIYSYFAGLQSQQVNIRQAVAAYAGNVLTRRASVIDQLGITATDVQSVLAALIDQMALDSQTVNRCTATVGSTTAASGNVGNGTVLTTKVLDGFNPPVLDAQAHLRYAGVNSEFCVTETMTVRCIADSYRDGLAAGEERFSWHGGLKSVPFDFQAEGSGDGPSLTASAGDNLLTNGDWESWSNTDTPGSWTLVAGTAGTHILREDTNKYRGDYALRLKGDGAVFPTVKQTFSAGQITARRMYCVSVRLRRSAGAAAGSLNIVMTGTGYTAGVTEQIDTTVAGGLTTSYVLHQFFFVAPASVPDDFALTIAQYSTALTAGESIYVDDTILTEVPYHGGVGAVVVPGSTPFVVGDQFTFTLSQTAGVLQDFFRRAFAVILPSSGAPTLADALGT